jgi:predicted HNH restriction endonuclease
MARREIGNECVICFSNRNLHYHEVHGLKHPTGYRYILSNKSDFVCLCSKCHYAIHLLGLYLTEDGLDELITILSGNSPNFKK